MIEIGSNFFKLMFVEFDVVFDCFVFIFVFVDCYVV